MCSNRLCSDVRRAPFPYKPGDCKALLSHSMQVHVALGFLYHAVLSYSSKLFLGGTDQYASHLAQIQERLAEALKPSEKPTVLIYRRVSSCCCSRTSLTKKILLPPQVLLCMRVLLLRFSTSKLRSFWPVMLTELVRDETTS